MKDDKRYGQLERKPDEILRDKPVKRYERGAGGRFAPRAAAADGDRPARSFGDRPSGDRPSRPYGDRPSGDRPSRPYGDRPSGDRPSRPYGDRPSGDRPSRPYGVRPSGDRPSRPYGDRPSGDRPSRPYGDRPSGDRPSRPYGDRPSGDRPSRPFGDRPSGDRPSRPYGDRPSGDRPSRPYGDRPARPFGDRPSGDRPSRPYGDRPSGDRPSRPYGDRPARPFGDRPSGDRPSRPYGDRPSGDRPSRPYGDRPARPFGDRPSGDRPSRPYGDRPARPFGDRPSGDRPSRPYGDRPARPFGDRPSGDRPASDRPYRPAAERPGRPPLGERPARTFRAKPVTNPEVAPFEVEPYDVVSLTQPEGYEQALPVTPNGDDVRATGVGDVDCLPVTVAEAELSAKPRKSRAKAKVVEEAAPEAIVEEPVSDEVSDEDAEAAMNLPGDRLEGRNPVMEALKAGRTLNKMWIQKGQHDPVMQRIISRAIEAGVVIQELDKRSMDKMAVTHGHQGVLAQVAAHDYVTLDQILDAAKEKGQPAFLLVLDELKESYNLGSILRIADAAGVHGVVIPERRSVSLDAAVAKASAGAVEHVAVARVTNIVQTLETLKDRGLWIAGTDAESTSDYSAADFKGPLAIVVGSEGEGLGHSVREHCDFLVGIPMAGQVNSLNAAVATGIVVFEAARQRRAAQAGR